MERLKRLIMVDTIMQTWEMLGDHEKASASNLFREATLESKPSTPLSLTASSIFDPPRPNRITLDTSQFASQTHQELDSVHDGVSQQEMIELLEHTGVSVSAPGELEPDLFYSTIYQRSFPSSPSTPHNVSDELLETISSLEPSLTDGEALSELIEDVEPGIVSLASPSGDLPEPPDVNKIGATLTSLYAEYRASLKRLRLVLQTASQPSRPESNGIGDSATEYLMSKTQAQLTLEEGTFWSKLEDLTFLQEDSSSQAADLVRKSRLLSDSYARRTSPPTTQIDRKSTRLNSSHSGESRMPSSA